MAKLTQSLGETSSFFVIARNTAKAVVPFDPGDTLTGKFSRGKDQASLLSPDLTWADAPAGKARVVITHASLVGAGVVPGKYHLEITATPTDGQPRGIFDGTYEITPSAGTGTPPTVYASIDDMLTYAPEIRTLLDKDVSETNFADQRHRARTRFEQARLDMYRPQPGRSRRLVDGVYSWGPAPDASPPPTSADVKGWFDGDRLMVTDDIREANARLAAAIIYLAQPGNQNVYVELGKRDMAIGERMMMGCVVDFDTSDAVSPTAGTVRIDRDVTYLT